MDQQTKYQVKMLQALVGATITEIVTDPDGIVGICTLKTATNANSGKQEERIIWILCDPEGNGPGFASVEPE